MDLADFLAAKLAQSSYRDIEALTNVSRGSLESIIKRQNTRAPNIETLTRIAKAYRKPLWEVMRLAGVDLDLPHNATEAAQRLAALLRQVPALERVVRYLQKRYDSDPDYVMGILIALEASLGVPPNGGSAVE